ncbi:MAG: hypothetical protein EON54_07815 [Alcaligenaceae bacterium]|nr:MAG: hypothetical protein EON54_07815 [Alcaligenaceae bacterium]
MSQGTWDSIAPSLPCSSPAATSRVPSYREYPLRQCVMSAEACFSRVGVVDSMCRRDRYFLKSDGVSARLFAANESALEEARVAASETYGPLILFGIPEIHSYLDEESEQTVHPVMFLRIRAQRAFAGAIIEELDRRFATVIEEYVEREFVVVRAEARLSDLLGCSQTLKRLTHASTAIWTWLLRYEAVVIGPLKKV